MAGKNGSPVKKRSKASNGTGRSVRSSTGSSMNDDDSQVGSMNDLNDTFFVENDVF